MKVFVYGTLKKNGTGYFWCQMQDQKCLGPAVANDVRLIRLDGRGFDFPALVRSNGDTVAGELFEIDDQTLRRMIQFEGNYYRMDNIHVDGVGMVMTFTWATSPVGYLPCPKDKDGNFHFPLDLQRNCKNRLDYT